MASKVKKEYIHYLIALIIGLALLFGLQPTNGLTDVGVRVVAVMVPTLYLWLTTNTHWTSLLFLGLLVMTGAMTANQVWAGSMGHFSVITMIVFMILNYCLLQTGVIDWVCNWFITRRIVHNRPYVFLYMFFASMMILGMFMDNLSLAVIYVGIAEVLCKKLDIQKGNSFYTCMFMGIMWVDVTISIASPIAHAPCLILMGMMSKQLGIDVSYTQWLGIGIPFAAIIFLVIMLCVRFWKPDTAAYDNYDVDAERRNAPRLDLRGRISVIVFLCAIALIILPEIFKGLLPAFCGFWVTCGVVVPAILACAALCIIHIDNKPLLDMPSALKSLPMGAIIFAGVVCVMSTPITSELTGINTWMGNCLQPLLAGVSPAAVVVIMALGALIMTNFLSNVVTMTLFFNIGVALLGGGSTDLGMYAILIGFSSSMACLTPSACAPMPLIFGPGHVTMGNTIRANLLFIVLSFAVLMAFVIPFAPLVIG